MKESMQELFCEYKHPSDDLVEAALKKAIRIMTPNKFLDINDLPDGWNLFWNHAYSGVSIL
jgi:hypothetical protein